MHALVTSEPGNGVVPEIALTSWMGVCNAVVGMVLPSPYLYHISTTSLAGKLAPSPSKVPVRPATTGLRVVTEGAPALESSPPQDIEQKVCYHMWYTRKAVPKVKRP